MRFIAEDGADVNWIGVKLFGIKENQWMIQALPNTLYDGTVGINLYSIYMNGYTMTENIIRFVRF